jgi:hypothetical protein
MFTDGCHRYMQLLRNGNSGTVKRKQLEETIRVHEINLHNLQTAHRSAADECLMLRYKNSLLERILLEKGKIRVHFKHLYIFTNTTS